MKIALAASLIAFVGLAGWFVVSANAQPGELIIVELYQSQGCSACPPANANVAAISDRSDVLALSFAVTYWDQLGWRDTFAQREFTTRQYGYARGLHHSNVYTPQVVVNGREDLSGIDSAELGAALSRAQRVASRVIMVANGVIQISAAPAQASADVWLVRYDRRTLPVPISAGENGGRTLPHKNIVRSSRGLEHGTERRRRSGLRRPRMGILPARC